jgi:hypothetical protein
MARNTIQRPRFFVDFPQYWKQRGTFPKSLYLLNSDNEFSPSTFSLELNEQFDVAAPADVNEITFKLFLNGLSETQTSGVNTALPMHAINEIEQINYFALFGHNFASQGLLSTIRIARGQVANIQGDSNDYIHATSHDEIFNSTLTQIDSKNYMKPNFDGTSIVGFNGWESNLHASDGTSERDAIKYIEIIIKKADATNFDGTELISLSGISIGRTFTMPISPDLKTSISFDYGIKSQDGLDGSTFEQIDWIEAKKLPTGFPTFYVANDLNPQHTGTSTGPLDPNYLQGPDRNMITATGRRTWTMNFTALDNDELFPANRMENFHTDNVESGTATTGNFSASEFQDYNNVKYFQKNISTDTSFYSMILNRTLGGSLPMIFQTFTNSSGHGNNNPGEFAIVKLAKRGLQFNVNTFNTYNIGLTVRESW